MIPQLGCAIPDVASHCGRASDCAVAGHQVQDGWLDRRGADHFQVDAESDQVGEPSNVPCFFVGLALIPLSSCRHGACLGRYATTIHAINSAVVKLKALTVVQRVYRGIAGLRLPDSFFRKNAHNIAGGVEYGFSSTTLEQETAMNYAKVKSAEQASTVLEAEMGMVDRGADIGLYSQFPGCACIEW